MALLMFVTSTGFAIDLHFCKNDLKTISLFGHAEACHHKQQVMPCHKMESQMLSESCHKSTTSKEINHADGCCQNKTLEIEKSTNDIAIAKVVTTQDVQWNAVVAFVVSYVFNYPIETAETQFALYKPPLPDRDVQVLYQTFLI